MLELTKEQMEAIQKAISKKAEESVQEFDKLYKTIDILLFYVIKTLRHICSFFF